MASVIFVEFAVKVSDDADLLGTIAGMEVSISGENVLSWELAHVCDDCNDPVVSNFQR
jgi:hypothetical protein